MYLGSILVFGVSWSVLGSLENLGVSCRSLDLKYPGAIWV